MTYCGITSKDDRYTGRPQSLGGAVEFCEGFRLRDRTATRVFVRKIDAESQGTYRKLTASSEQP